MKQISSKDLEKLKIAVCQVMDFIKEYSFKILPIVHQERPIYLRGCFEINCVEL